MHACAMEQQVLRTGVLTLSRRVQELIQPLQGLAGFLLFACGWFIFHPYLGVAGDAVLYTVQALRHLHPERYAGDVFFLGMSQDEYTLFSPIYARTIDLLGMGRAAKALSILAGVLWCYAAWQFSKVLSDLKCRGLYLFLLAAMPITFGGYGILSVDEPFPAPRLWANGLSLLACAFWIKGRRYSAGMAWGAGMLLHPLMALAGCCFVLIYEFRPNRYWLLALILGFLAVLLLGLMDVPLFGRLFQVMNPEWFDLVYQRTSLFMFPSRWNFADYGAMTFHLTLLAWAFWLERKERIGKVFGAAGLLGFLGWLVSLLGGDLLHSVLILQVQPWRFLWFSYVAGWAAAAYLAVRHWHAARPLVLALALAWLSHEEGGVAILWLVLLVWRLRDHLGHFHVRMIEIALLAGMAAEVCSSWTAFTLSLNSVDEVDVRFDWERLYYGFRTSLPPRDQPLLVLLVAPLVLWGWKRSRLIVLGVFVPIGLFLLSDWDSHLDAGRLMRPETYAAQGEGFWGSSPFNKYVPVTAEIYWPEGIELTWLAMGRASYFSLHQSAGLVFSEDLAREVHRRFLALKPLGGRDQFFKLLTLEEKLKLQSAAIPVGTLEGLRTACITERNLDFVILRTHYKRWVVASWYAPFLGEGAHLYSCESFRRHTNR